MDRANDDCRPLGVAMNRRTALARAVGGACALALGARAAFAGESATNISDEIARAMADAELSMQFRGATPGECRDWQNAFRARLSKLVGDSTPPEHWTVLEESRVELDDHVRHEVLLQAPHTASLPVYLLVPIGLTAKRRAPGVVCVHGHGPFGNDPIVGRREVKGVAENIEKHNYDYGMQFVRRGYVVVAPCLIPFGRRVLRERYGGNDPCAVTFVRMQALGKLPIAANLRDLRWAIDLLQSRADVDDRRIGCAGLSYGGRMTMMVAAMDQRVRVAAVSGALNLMQERMTLRHSCGSQMIPGLLKYGDYAEIGSLIAPRPCVWETGSNDALIVPKWDDVFRDRLRRAYVALGAADQLRFDRFVGGHVWNGKVAFKLFDEVLKS